MYRTLLYLALVLLSACSQTAEFLRPTPPIPTEWPASAVVLGKEDAVKTHWQAFFTDPRLQSLISIALENSRDLRIAAARVEEARAQFGVARADLMPTLNFGSDSSVSALSGTYEIDFWGRIAGMNESARVNFLSTQEAQRAVQLALIADVASTYFGLLQVDELITLTGATVDLREQSVALVRKGRDLGGLQDFEVQQSFGLLESSRGTLAALGHQRAIAANKLDFLVGQATVALPPGRTLDEQGLELDIAPGLPSGVLLLRPDVISAEQRLKSAHANVGVARTAFFPKILLSTGYGAATQSLTTLAGAGAWYFVPIISAIPLFDNGRTSSGVDIAQARKVIAVAEYEKTIQQAFREVADLLSLRRSLADQLRSSIANSNAQGVRLQISQARHSAGLVSYLEVLDSQREVLAAQQATTQFRRAQLESAAQLYKALGGGEPRSEVAKL
jgi:multidrug efflux system outer membrane protein